jgi:hypothetical protein
MRAIIIIARVENVNVAVVLSSAGDGRVGSAITALSTASVRDTRSLPCIGNLCAT